MKQKLLLMLMALMTTIAASAYHFRAVNDDGVTIYYNKNSDGTSVEVTSVTSGSYSGKVVIPESVEYDGNNYTVTSIGECAFYRCSGLISVTIPNSVTSIGYEAFYYCSSLTEVTIPNSVTSIGNWAFDGCSGLTAVHISDLAKWCNTDFVGDDANPLKNAHNLYLNGEKVEHLIIPESVTSIGNYAFCGCSGLTEVTIPNSVTSIGDYAFDGCSGLTAVHISDLAKWCNTDFGDIYGNPLLYARNLYLNGEKVEHLIIPNSVTSIGAYAFEYCLGLTEVTIPSSVTSIGERAFAGCWSLTEVTIPNSVTSIRSGAFSDCYLLNTLNTDLDFLLGFDSTKENLKSFTNINVDGKPLSSLNIPDDMTSFSNWDLVLGCASLKSINTGDGLKSLPSKYITGNSVNSVTLGKSLTSLGKVTFPNATLVMSHTDAPPTITAETFPKCAYGEAGVVIVDTSATQTAYSQAAVWEDLQISNLNNVAEVTVTTPGDISFDLIDQCGMAVAKVVGLKVHGALNDDDFQQMKVNMKALMNVDLSDADMSSIPANALAGKISLSSINLPSTCTEIGENAFQGCINLNEAVINSACKTIGQNAFNECHSLSKISIPSSVTSISGYAFANSALSTVTFDNGLLSIGDYAFQNTSLGSVTLPNTLKTIGIYAFEDSHISSIVFGRSLTSIGDYAFKGCKITQQLELPEDLTTIGAGAFEGQEGITGHLTIYDKVTSVGDAAFAGTSISSVFLSNKMAGINASTFAGCKNLDIVYLPDNVGYLGESAFDGCSSLTQLRIPSTLDEIGAAALRSSAINSVKVPEPVTEIKEATFAQCLSLRSVSLPAGVDKLEAEAFNGCKALRNLSIKAVTPPTVKDESVFKGVNTDLCVLSIPTASYRDYVLADYWGQFIQMRNDIEVETEGDGEITYDSEEESSEPEEETTEPESIRHKAAMRRASATSTADNGSTLYVPKNGSVRFFITPAEGEHIISVTYDGKDVTNQVVDGSYVAVADKKGGKLVVKFSGSSGVKDVNYNSVSEPEVYYNLQGIRVANPVSGNVYVVKRGSKTCKVLIK